MAVDGIDRISKLLRPKSIALAGASPESNKMVARLMATLRACGYRGAIYPINPRYKEINGLKCYPSVTAIEADVDHCIVAVPQSSVLEIVEECRKKGIAGATILSSGYAEAGSSGAQEQEKLVRAAGEMAFIGPNCMGFANLVDNIIAAPAAVIQHEEKAGNVAVLSQSGGLGFATFAYFAQQSGIGFSYVVNTGNSIGVSYSDLIRFLFLDESTKVIFVIAEADQTVAQILNAVRQEGLVKPIVLFKVGRGATGMRMAMSHTGSLAGDYRLVRDCAEQAGIICADDMDEAVGVTNLMSCGFGAENADGLASLCISGGNVTMFADAVDAQGLRFAHLSDETSRKLQEVLPDFISVHNPVDLTSFGTVDQSSHGRVMEVLSGDPEVRTLVPILTTYEDYTRVCQILTEFKRSNSTAVAVLWAGGSYESGSRKMLLNEGIPIFSSATVLARSLDRIRRAIPAEKESVSGSEPNGLAFEGRHGMLMESESLAFLNAAGVPVPRFTTSDKSGVVRAAGEVGFPIVIKSDASETHLSDKGGVIVGIRDADDLKKAASRIARLPGNELLICQYLPGHELVASTFSHPIFGPVLMVGSGGQLVEIISDVRFVTLPVGKEHLGRVLASTLIGRALKDGFRGAQGFDAAVSFLQRLSQVALKSAQWVTQIELNPITVGAHGAVAVDAAVVLK